MKKLIFILILFVPTFIFAGCDKNNPDTEEPPGGNETPGGGGEEVTPGNGKALVVFFSRYGNTDFSPDYDLTYDNPVDAISSASIVRNQHNLSGTTEVVANFICAAVGADKHLIRTEAVYPVDYDAVISQNHREQSDNFLPPLKDRIENMEQYEVIFIGYPVWSSTTPMAILSFLNEYDLSGKTIVPFATHNGYGAGRSFTAVRNACPNSTTLDGLSLSSVDVQTSQTNINQWIDRIGVKDLIGKDTPIRVTAGNTVMDGVFYDTELARESISYDANNSEYGCIWRTGILRLDAFSSCCYRTRSAQVR